MKQQKNCANQRNQFRQLTQLYAIRKIIYFEITLNKAFSPQP